jgi:L-alanine-DL-glutamate epimerase-like enolase superfamily enzyme
LTIIRLGTPVVEGDFDLAFIHAETETITDLGECFFAPGLTPILSSLELLLHAEGSRDIHRLFRKHRLASRGAGSIGCIIYSAISAIEAALRGVLGQSLGVAVHRLLVITLSEASSRVRAPIATGENLSLFEGFEEIMASHALSIVAPHLQKLGSLAVTQSTAQFADVHTMPVALHNLSSPAGVLLSAHFCAGIPNCLEREFHGSDVSSWNGLVDGLPKPMIHDGFFSVPDNPGLGVKLNEEIAHR